MTRLYIVRHGQTQWNVEGRLQGSADRPLNAEGLEQAERAGQSLRGVVHAPAVLVTSPLIRARATADVIAATVGVPVEEDARLAERAYGVWEGLTWEERLALDPVESKRWLARKEPNIEGYESHEAVVVRMRQALDEWWERAAGANLVFVTHGSSARMLMLSLLGLATDTHALGNLENASWSRLRPVDDAPWSLERHNIGADA